MKPFLKPFVYCKISVAVLVLKGGVQVDIILYLFLGIGIGVLSGFFGIGGGFILTPVLLLMNFSPVIAIATSLMYTIATSLSGVFAHFRLQNIQWKTAFIIGISGVIATQAAFPFVLFLEKFQIEDTIIPLFYILLIVYFSYSLLRTVAPTTSFPSFEKDFKLYKAIVIGLFAGIVSTTLGVGGGFIIVPLLITILSFHSRNAVGTSLLSVLMIVSAGFATYASTTPIDFKVSGSLIIGALIGGQIGAIFTEGFNDKQIRHYLGTLYAITGVSLLLKLFNIGFIGLSLLLAYCIFLLVILSVRTVQFKIKQHEAKLVSK